MAVYVSRHPHLKLVGAPTPDRVVDFGKDNPPGQFDTEDAGLISWLESHDLYGIAFYKDALPEPTEIGEVFVPTDIDALHKALSDSMISRD